MNNPKLSVIVPVYNVEKYLPQCMDSLLNQTLTDIEVILVDDGSPDNCPSLCDEYAKQDQRVKVVHKGNGGLGYARNSGIEIATGEYIAFLDSDDYVELNTYQKLYSIAKDTKADAVYYNYQRFNDFGEIWTEMNIREKMHFRTKDDIRGFMLNMIANPPKAVNDSDINCSSCCVLYSSKMINKYGLRFKSERDIVYEDLPFNLEYLLHSSNVIAIPEIFYNYRVNPSSLTRTANHDRIEKNYFYYQYLLDIMRTNNFGEDGYLRVSRLFIGYSRACIRRYVQSPLSKKEKMQWLKKVVNLNYWNEIASSYPYTHLPLKYALHFYLLQKGYFRLLYYFSTLGKIR